MLKIYTIKKFGLLLFDNLTFLTVYKSKVNEFSPHLRKSTLLSDFKGLKLILISEWRLTE
jgi:hypothetical protein